MQHHVCSECRSTADYPKVCETEGCAKKGQDMAACTCTDGKHEQVVKQGK